MKRRHLLSGLAAALLLAGCAQAPKHTVPDEPLASVPTPAKKPPRIGLVLGGGAARGFAHIGVIQALEEAGVRPELVVGTSVVAALYASGKGGAELQKIAEGMDEASLSDWQFPFAKPGMLKGEALARFIRTQVSNRQIQDLTMPLGVVATDLHNGQAILFQRGDTATAVRASSAIPAVFQPVSIAGREYVDGGLVSPVPVRFARQMGAELVIAVDISSPIDGNAASDTLQILMQTFSIMGRSINAFELSDADVVVRPSMAGLVSTSFASRGPAILAGRQAMRASLSQLRSVIQAKSY